MIWSCILRRMATWKTQIKGIGITVESVFLPLLCFGRRTLAATAVTVAMAATSPAWNAEDHYGDIVGYPVDYATGEPTDDQDRKPS